jgi:uncharacterized protein (TIGR02594 family)
MRVFFLAATALCLMGMAAYAQPSKMRPEGSGLVEYVALTPASGPISDSDFEVSKIESITSANARSVAIDPKASRIAGLAATNIRPAKMKPQRSNVEPIRSTNAELTDLDPESSGAARLTGALRDVGSPWLEHAINDVGTNPTGWKRLWCAKSLNMWLERSGKRGCGGNTAISCLNAGRKLSGPQVGAIAVMKHHVGIVKEVHGGHVTLVSGNNSGRSGARKVGVSKYARGRVMAYVWPE